MIGGEKVYKSINKKQHNQKGSAMLMTTIILLILSIIIASGISLSGMTFDLAVFKRNTSNTYYLAQSAVEKYVDTMNKAIETSMGQIIESAITPNYIDENGIKTSAVKHDKDKHILTASDNISTSLQTAIHTHLKDNYVGKTIEYAAQSDRASGTNITTIKIKVEDKDTVSTLNADEFKVTATATTRNSSKTQVYDEQIVEAVVKINMPTNIENEIHERYAFANGNPDILSSGLLCYSDVWVSGGGKLSVNGDVRVGGTPNIKGDDLDKDGIYIYPEVDQNGGVIAINGGTIDFQKNLYCTRNVLATNGWGGAYDSSTSIKVAEDTIAYTIGVIDDFYEGGTNQSPFNGTQQVKNASITISQNAMVDNDVMIDRWVNTGKINITKTLFGVSDGTGETDNPNQSSGVFSQGPGCLIEASRMYVAGQPFITFGEQNPIRLWESIGEPFEGLSSWPGYQLTDDSKGNASYLSPDSPFLSSIVSDKVKTNFEHTFAMAKVSAINSNDGSKNVGEECKKDIGSDGSDAIKFFYQVTKANGKTIGDVMDAPSESDEGYEHYKKYETKVNGVLGAPASTNLKGGTVWSTRDLGAIQSARYEGLKGYMTLMRAILYNAQTDNTKPLSESTFSDVVDINKITASENKWSYATPIELGKETISLADYYVIEGGSSTPYPTLIINKDSTKTLEITASSGKDTLYGWIISAGPVVLGKDVKINGGIIVGGPTGSVTDRATIFSGGRAGVRVSEGTVEITHNAQSLLDLQVQNHQLYREILDALMLTDYTESALSSVMAKQSIYTKAALKYSKDSILEINTEDIHIGIESLKTK